MPTKKVSPSKKRKVNRSAITGKFVTKNAAKDNPNTTVTEKVKLPK